MATKVTLSDNVPITKDDNTPTTYFVRQLQLLLDETLAAAVAAAEADAAAAAAQATADAAVPQTRLINTAAPITGGGDLTADLNLGHAVSGVTAASYTNANITVNADGHVTAASNGTSGGTGSVTSVSVTTAAGVSGSVATPTTTPAITITLGAITPTSVHSTGTVLGSNLSGTNTGDQTTVSGNAGSATILQTARNFSITGGGITAAAVSFNGSAVVTLNASVDAGHITLARMANLAANSFIGNNTGSSATPIAMTIAQAKSLLNYVASEVGAAKARPVYASGKYFTPSNTGTVATGTAVTAGTIYFTPVFFENAFTMASLIARVATPAVGGHAELSLYAADPATNDPTGNPLYTTASLGTASGGIIGDVGTAALAVNAGLYWAAFQCDNSTNVFNTFNANRTEFTAFIGQKATGATMLTSGSNNIGYSLVGSYGTWPTLTGTGTDADALVLSNNKPTPFGFKVA